MTDSPPRLDAFPAYRQCDRPSLLLCVHRGGGGRRTHPGAPAMFNARLVRTPSLATAFLATLLGTFGCSADTTESDGAALGMTSDATVKVHVIDDAGTLGRSRRDAAHREERRRVARRTHRRTVPHPARVGDRVRRHRRAARQQSRGRLRLRGVRPAALQLGHQVQVGHRMAELLRCDRGAERCDEGRSQPRHDARRDQLRAV